MKPWLIGLLWLSTAVSAAAPPSGQPPFTALEQAATALKNGAVSDALRNYEQLVTEQPNSAAAQQGLGSARLMSQHYREAIPAFQQAVSLGAEDGNAFIGMAVAYLHLGLYDRAGAALQEAKTRKPTAAAEIDRLLAWISSRSATPSIH